MLRYLVLVVGLLLVPSLARADKAGPGTTVVKTANDTISGLLKMKAPPAGSQEEKDLAAKVTTSVRGFLDIDELGKRAMADNWAKLTKDQQKQFQDVLRELIEANYVKGLRANVAYQVEYTGESVDKDGNTLVTTKVKAERKGKPFAIEVDYVLVKEGATLKAFDVKTDGVGLVENYRVMFDKIMTRDKFEGLIKRMQDKKSKI